MGGRRGEVEPQAVRKDACGATRRERELPVYILARPHAHADVESCTCPPTVFALKRIFARKRAVCVSAFGAIPRHDLRLIWQLHGFQKAFHFTPTVRAYSVHDASFSCRYEGNAPCALSFDTAQTTEEGSGERVFVFLGTQHQGADCRLATTPTT